MGASSWTTRSRRELTLLCCIIILLSVYGMLTVFFLGMATSTTRRNGQMHRLGSGRR